jgi:hypothetical protein
MHDVVTLNRIPADSAVLRRLPNLSPDAMQYVLALLAFRHLTGRTGIVRMSEIISSHEIAPKSSIINELFEAGIMGQRKDGIVIYHPIIQAMMAPLPAHPCDSESGSNNIIAFQGNKHAGA